MSAFVKLDMTLSYEIIIISVIVQIHFELLEKLQLHLERVLMNVHFEIGLLLHKVYSKYYFVQ